MKKRDSILLLAAALAVGLTGVSDAQAGSFLTNSPMSTARWGHTATLLRNGTVLVCGGDAAGSGELYDPATGAWTATGPMLVARFGHTATLLPEGKVLVVGGFLGRGNNVPGCAELYDPATGKWAETGALTTIPDAKTAILLRNGKVLATGDPANPTDTSKAAIYDPAAGTWTPTSAMRIRHIIPTATLLRDGQVLLAGDRPNVLASDPADAGGELYNPATGKWATIATPLPLFANRSPSATLMTDGKVLFVGEDLQFREEPGSSVAQLYDPVRETWSVTGAMKEQRGDHTATLLSDGKVFVAGGVGSHAILVQGGLARRFPVLSSAELYDPASGTWAPVAGHLATERCFHTATLLPDGKVLMTGGLKDTFTQTRLSSTELYDPELQKEYDKTSPVR